MSTTTKPDQIQAHLRRVAATMDALSEIRRLVIFRTIVSYARPVQFKELRESMRTPQSTLSRILHQLERARLVKLTTNLDRTVTVAVNTDTLHEVAGFLVQAHTRLVPPKERAATGT